MTEPKCEFLSQNPGASLIFVNFGTPPHYLGLQKYTRECVKSRLMVRIGQNRPTFRVISAKKIHQLDKSTASAAVLTNMSKVRAEAGVFGQFRDLLPPHLFDQGGELHHGRQRVGLTPDLLLRIPTPDGVGDWLGEIKVMSAGVSRYPAGRTEKQADRRARELPGSYRRPLERLDQLVRGTAPGETIPVTIVSLVGG